MTRLTALLIQGDPDVYPSAFGPMENGKFGLYVGTWDEAPSGWKRPRTLLTSEPIYDNADAAIAAAEQVIADVRSTDVLRGAHATNPTGESTPEESGGFPKS